MRGCAGADGIDDYEAFMSLLYAVLDGSLDSAKYEDECRALMGTGAYMLFTLDKLVLQLVKQLAALATDDSCIKLQALYDYEHSSFAKNAGSSSASSASTDAAAACLSSDSGAVAKYYSKCVALTTETLEDSFRFEFTPGKRRVAKGRAGGMDEVASPGGSMATSRWEDEPVLKVTYLGCPTDQDALTLAGNDNAEWSQYVEQYLYGRDPQDVDGGLDGLAVPELPKEDVFRIPFMSRNQRKVSSRCRRDISSLILGNT